MKINNLLQKLNQKQLNILLQLQNNNQQVENHNNDGNNNSKISSLNLPQLAQLEESIQKLIIKIWLEMNIPLKQKHLTQLIKHLQNYSMIKTGAEETHNESASSLNETENNLNINNLSAEKKININNTGLNSSQTTNNAGINNTPVKPELLIKSFAFFIKKDLPLLPKLMVNVARNLDQQSSIAENIVDNLNISQNQTETVTENQPSLSNVSNNLSETIKNNLILNLSQNPEEIFQKLQNYPEQLRETMQILTNSSDNSNDNILNRLLGQQVLNLQDFNQENNLLLTLELPVIMGEDNNPIPLYLQVREDTETKDNRQKASTNDNYKINFIIELEKRGPIREDIEINSKIIKSKFLATSSHTISLIKNFFPNLKQRLEQIGYQVNSPEIKQVDNSQELNRNQGDTYPEPVFTEKKQKKNENEYVHIDFKI